MSAKKVPVQTAKEPLHRTVNSTRRDGNRKASVKQCERYWGANYTQRGGPRGRRVPLRHHRRFSCAAADSP
jgi:hypothetical protein